jgi:pimeloyl-ACP methyl ester carboxylesterase
VTALDWTPLGGNPALGDPVAMSTAASSWTAGAERALKSGARLTVIGHSYGATTVTKAAAAAPLDADNLVLLGSPGADVDSVTDLHLVGVPAGMIGRHVYATASGADPVADTPGFIWADGDVGIPPAAVAAFSSPSHGPGVLPAGPGYRTPTHRRTRCTTNMLVHDDEEVRSP